jgi:hypothetical protein
MKRMECEHARDGWPDLLANRLSAQDAVALRTHVQSCADCRAEFEVASTVARARLNVPAGLETRIQSAVRGRTPVRGRWPVAAAASIAVVVLGASALVGTLLSGPDRPPPVDVETQGAGWFGVDDAFLYGTSSLGDLSSEELNRLLVELDS